ncbi:8-oxoguanine glycosylase ogg1 [Terramyces sp. JEL0728]|nr:8-oxoguanine glycosylase ogg1 [Terramyces sp. JEL0728]
MTWFDLNVSPVELRLDKTLPTGQCFRWIQTNPMEWTMVLNAQLITLKQTPDTVLFKAENEELCRKTLEEYFQLNVCLKDLMDQWSTDKNFKTKQIQGLRVMKQPKLENIFSFICSSNNNISRITSFGKYIGTVEGIDFHEFPHIIELQDIKEPQLRELGFGYRAKYIVESVEIIRDSGVDWVDALSAMEYLECKQELMKLSGVGPKVADCICLMSMDKIEAIPVDTHVWQIATRDYGMAKGKTLNAKVYQDISMGFYNIFGSYCG